ncbi:MAG: hypothetical protein HY049_04485 [Acidobacteria bacterium]|nr:hypothetical protein [Acidobacteriota bacterium]
MSDAVSAYLASILIGSPQVHENLTLLPLLASRETPVEYVSLDDALKSGQVEIAEIHEAGSVQNIKVVNRGASKVLILDGEQLVGAKQNRISNASFIIPEMSERVIPVSCIEEGRWRSTSKSFGGTDSMYAAFGRRAKLHDTTSMLRVKREFRSDQIKVWDTVKKYLGESGTASSTGSFVDYQDAKRGDLDAYLAGFRSEPGQVGVMVLIDGKLQGLDTFGRLITWQGVFRKLIRSYAMDAIVRATVEPAPGARAPLAPQEFLDALDAAPRESFDSPGEGVDIRIETDALLGAALVLRDGVLHLTAFPKT